MLTDLGGFANQDLSYPVYKFDRPQHKPHLWDGAKREYRSTMCCPWRSRAWKIFKTLVRSEFSIIHLPELLCGKVVPTFVPKHSNQRPYVDFNHQ